MKRNTTIRVSQARAERIKRARAALLKFLSKRPVRELTLFTSLVGLRTPTELVRAVRSHAEVWKGTVD